MSSVAKGRAVEAVQIRQYNHSALLIVCKPASILRGHPSSKAKLPSLVNPESLQQIQHHHQLQVLLMAGCINCRPEVLWTSAHRLQLCRLCSCSGAPAGSRGHRDLSTREGR